MKTKLGKNKNWVELLVFSGVLLAVVWSCSDDFLDTENTDVLATDNFPARVEDIDLMVNDVYGRIRFGFFDGYPHAIVGVGASHYGDQAFSDDRFDQGSRANFNPDNPIIREIWDKHYENIGKANATLEAIERLRTNGTILSGDELQTLSYREGEILFLRAWNYYYLINFFGESFITPSGGGERRGVPLINRVPVSLEETQRERATVQQVWDFIKRDLRQSEALLDNKTWDGDQRARVGIWAVKGFMGRAHVFTQQWDSAMTVLRDVIDNSGSSLVSFDVYANMFNNENTFNSESIFEINYNDSDVSVGGWGKEDASTLYPILIGPNYYADPAENSPTCNGFCNFFLHDKSILRFGWTDTTRITYNRPEYIDLSNRVRQDQSVDPRLWVNAQQPRVDSIFVDDNMVAIAKNRGEGDMDTRDDYAWSFRKFTLTSRNFWSGPQAAIAMNMYWLRLADVYLLYAEANLNAGDNATALEYINKVRRRAYDLPIDAASAVDYPSLTAPTMASTGDPLSNDPLKYERWAELFGEHGSWWFDVCRWRIGAEEAAYYERVNSGELNWNDNRNYALPIPQTQINADNIGQNPGY